MRKPEWLSKKVSLKDCRRMQDELKGLNLHTVCQEAGCPNISECFSRGEAAFMILGKVCTRNCRFCGVEKGEPLAVDRDEPRRVAEAVRQLKLRHTVITSVTRDDLDDAGAGLFAETISAIRKKAASSIIEVLIPDFKGQQRSIEKIVEQKPEVINHNLETVPRLYKELRPEADYQRSLEVLRIAKSLSNSNGIYPVRNSGQTPGNKISNRIYTKSGLMVGLGETDDEISEVLADLRKIDCDFLSIGQYLSPSRSHYPVKEYITPEKFSGYKKEALGMGFLYAASGPYVRSSYCAGEYFSSV